MSVEHESVLSPFKMSTFCFMKLQPSSFNDVSNLADRCINPIIGLNGYFSNVAGVNNETFIDIHLATKLARKCNLKIYKRFEARFYKFYLSFLHITGCLKPLTTNLYVSPF